MKRTFLLFLALLLLTCLPLAAEEIAAEEIAVDLNPSRTSVTFTLGDVLHTVHGAFKLKRGNLRFDTATGKATGEIVVDVASGDSGNNARDRRMHKDILESAKYPEAVFIPDHITGTMTAEGESRLDAHGVFQLHDTSHEMILHFLVQNHNGELSATADFVIPYVQWGLKNPSTFVLRVSAKVQMHIQASGSVRRQELPPSARSALEFLHFHTGCVGQYGGTARLRRKRKCASDPYQGTTCLENTAREHCQAELPSDPLWRLNYNAFIF